MRDPHSRDAGSIPARVAEYSQVVELGYTRRSERRALCGMGVRISPWLLIDGRRGDRVMVQFHPRSFAEDWSVGVSAARVLGKDEGRVQFPDGPLTNKWG